MDERPSDQIVELLGKQQTETLSYFNNLSTNYWAWINNIAEMNRQMTIIWQNMIKPQAFEKWFRP